MPLEEIAGRLEELRRLDGVKRPLDETPLVPGLRFRLDPEAGFDGAWDSDPGRLFVLRTRPIRQPGHWLGLHLELGQLETARLPYLGLVARAAATRATAIRVALRSGRAEGGFTDRFFPRHMLALPGEVEHLDMISPERDPDIPAEAPWRELILFLPPREPLEIALHDLRIFAP